MHRTGYGSSVALTNLNFEPGIDPSTGRIEERRNGSKDHFILSLSRGSGYSTPGGGIYFGVTPGFSLDVIDKPSFLITRESHVHFFLSLVWNGKELIQEDARPVFSQFLGDYRWTYDIVKNAPNSLTFRIHLVYFPDEKRREPVRQIIGVTVDVIETE